MADQNRHSLSEEKTVKSPNVLERVKEEIEAMGHHEESRSHSHHHTAIDDVKGPGFFERVKEEVEAIVGAVTPKRSSKK
ncbi:unnamed protein product [Thlaspi arvense]|uniref:Uncharacterized protein n=1 Tax=Thlaspi arvense TaxID=13288 RepID=A0AAU9SN85_THLAR|nr:unnamed protein product [Thlaspi arvense]